MKLVQNSLVLIKKACKTAKMNKKLLAKRETYTLSKVWKIFMQEIVTSYKQDSSLGAGKKKLLRHLLCILVNFKGRFLGFVFLSYAPLFT